MPNECCDCKNYDTCRDDNNDYPYGVIDKDCFEPED